MRAGLRLGQRKRPRAQREEAAPVSGDPGGRAHPKMGILGDYQ
jgi:hypothetical protein